MGFVENRTEVFGGVESHIFNHPKNAMHPFFTWPNMRDVLSSEGSLRSSTQSVVITVVILFSTRQHVRVMAGCWSTSNRGKSYNVLDTSIGVAARISASTF